MRVSIDSKNFEMLVDIYVYAYEVAHPISETSREYAMGLMVRAVDDYTAYITAQKQEAPRVVA
ncbi:MAG: hypothetical protein FWD73_07065 [Polyangiaceae bacterium]|nr:hypothetical protein [Polyangiaceae bacterium]